MGHRRYVGSTAAVPANSPYDTARCAKYDGSHCDTYTGVEVNMSIFIDKLRALEKEIAQERGDFVLFALVQREETMPGRWDLLVSAPWFEKNEKATLDYLAEKLNATLSAQEMIQISRIILFPPDDPRLQEFKHRVKRPVVHGNVELSRWTFSNMPVSHAHIVTST
jgi:hypothetical protein